MSNLIFSQNSQKIANLRAISSRERCKVFFLRRRRLTPSETWWFKKKWYQKTMISDSKTWKILKVQKWHQKASRSLKSRVMSKFWIWEFGNFRAISPWENGSLLMEKGFSALQKRWEVFIFMRTLHTALHNLCNIDHVYMYLDIYSQLATLLLFSFIRLSFLFVF